jgi:hypothetical protein
MSAVLMVSDEDEEEIGVWSMAKPRDSKHSAFGRGRGWAGPNAE